MSGQDVHQYVAHLANGDRPTRRPGNLTRFRAIIVSIALSCVVPTCAAQSQAKEWISPILLPQVGQSALQINSVSSSGDGRLLVTGGSDGLVKLWDVAKGLQLRVLTRLAGAVLTTAFSENGRYIAAAGYDGRIQVCDVSSAAPCNEVATSPNSNSITPLAFSADGRSLAWGEGSILRLSNWQTNRIPKRFATAKSNITAIVLSPDGRRIAFSAGNEETYLWDVDQATGQKVIKQGSAPVTAICFSSSAEILATANTDGVVSLWSAADARSLGRLSTISFMPSLTSFPPRLRSTQSVPAFPPTVSMGFRKDGTLVTAVAGNLTKNLQIGIWNVRSRQRMDGSSMPVIVSPGIAELSGLWPITVGGGGQFIAYSKDLQTISIVGVPNFQLEKTLGRSAEVVSAVSIDSNRNLIAAATGKNVHLWNVQTGKEEAINTRAARTIRMLSLNSDGSRLTAASDDSGLFVFDTTTRRESDALTGECDFAYSDPWWVACGHYTGVIDLRKITSDPIPPKMLLKTEPIATHSIGGFAVSEDGKLAALSEPLRGQMRVWRTADNETVHYTRSFFTPWGQLAFNSGGTELAWTAGKQIQVMNINSGVITELCCHGRFAQTIAFSPDGSLLASGGQDATIKIWNVSSSWQESNRQIGLLPGHTDVVSSVAFSYDGRLLISGSYDGTIRLWDWPNQRELVDLSSVEIPGRKEPIVGSAPDRSVATSSIMYTRDGRFDINSEEDLQNLSWVMPDDRLKIQPAELYMRDYFEPRLLPRLLACHETEVRSGRPGTCKNAFKEVRPLAELNRIQPGVRIVKVERGTSAKEALVTIEVSGKEDTAQSNGKTRTDVYDVRLFRDGQLVGQWPEPQGGIGGAENITSWRKESLLPMPAGQIKTTHQFPIRLASRDKGQWVRFTAYAFNEDRVKSGTAYANYRVPDDVDAAKPRAYVITIGINAYENPNWRLGFAVKDAQDLSDALQQIPGYEVIPVSLVSTADGVTKVDQANKTNIKGVLALLSGNETVHRDRLIKAIGSIANKLQKATPDDLVILAFSGHGYTDEQGRFYLLPSDSGTENMSDAALPKILPRLISSDELSLWLREVDAGELVMLIDACHSAASVPEAFKPGPMGDRGLGQLAYDKGMQILAATQADNVALEVDKVGGLLTYALVQDGLEQRKASPDGREPISIRAWLRYAEKRVPQLYDDIQARKLKLAGFDKTDHSRSLVSKDPTIDSVFYSETVSGAQTPALFDFYKGHDPTIRLEP